MLDLVWFGWLHYVLVGFGVGVGWAWFGVVPICVACCLVCGGLAEEDEDEEDDEEENEGEDDEEQDEEDAIFVVIYLTFMIFEFMCERGGVCFDVLRSQPTPSVIAGVHV